MGKIAVDVVLLIPDEMADRAIELNRKLAVRASGSQIVLNKNDCLPHLSLAMGCMEQAQLGEAESILRDVAKTFHPVRITAGEISGNVNSHGQVVSVLMAEKTEQLQELHEMVMRKFRSVLSYDVTVEMFAGPDDIEATTLEWVGDYPSGAAFDNFSPHITIGYGGLSVQSISLMGGAAELAICHLGNHCTCRKVLKKVRFS